MGKFNRGGGGGFGGNRGGGSRFGGGGGRDREVVMHKAVCSNCGSSCEVPFRPSGDKPVYCNDCFSKKGGGSSDRNPDRAPRREFSDRAPRPSFGGGDAGQANGEVKRQLDVLNSKIDKLAVMVENLSKVNSAPVSAPKKAAAKAPAKKAATKAPAKKGKK
jgi:CxxC-x17-CxxC domain-containing protein